MKRKEPPVQVRPAEFGQGVFATKKIRKGQVIGEVHGQVVLDPDYTSRYCMELGNGQTLEPREPFRFLNHSCLPNCELIYYDPATIQPGQEHCLDKLFVQATRTIPAGGELLIDYAWPADHAIPCGCQAEKCRGWIVSDEELHLVVDEETPPRQVAHESAGVPMAQVPANHELNPENSQTQQQPRKKRPRQSLGI
ncbi:MAG: SET domain-containing protein [Pirellulales bacterium]|nr:SET domain-containing protein [Pirellulales bacterium]